MDLFDDDKNVKAIRTFECEPKKVNIYPLIKVQPTYW